MSRLRLRATAALVAATAAIAGATAQAAPQSAPAYKPIGLSGLTVTQGTITPAGTALQTQDPGMRATHNDGGVHRRSARLWFQYLGESTTTVPLGSGAIRRQIGLKLRAADPCNLVYVMWHAYPTSQIEVSVKRNPGLTTSAQCGNAGYTEIAEIPLTTGGIDDHSAHRLEVRTRRRTSGDLAVSIYTDRSLLRRLTIPAALAAGLDGPIGVRSDNGNYLFRLSAK